MGGAIGAQLLIDGAGPAAKQGGEPQQHGDRREERRGRELAAQAGLKT